VGKVVGVIATVLVAIAAATGVNAVFANVAAPDKDVNLENPDNPNGMSGRSGAVQYGSTTP
jgi:hypothetical protein